LNKQDILIDLIKAQAVQIAKT